MPLGKVASITIKCTGLTSNMCLLLMQAEIEDAKRTGRYIDLSALPDQAEVAEAKAAVEQQEHDEAEAARALNGAERRQAEEAKCRGQQEAEVHV